MEITEDMLACPNCKKVLKLVCPKCKTTNKSNTCKKCGFSIISKCNKCGKINQTISEKCTKCGFSTYTSVSINSSNIDEFACLTVEFPNLKELKSILGSTKLTEKFKANLDQLILDFSGSIGTTREIIKDVYIIRFNKDSSFKDSARNAISAAIEIQKMIANLNFRLNKAKDATLECKIAVLKRDIHSKPDDYKSGFDIKLIYKNKNELKLINHLQVITDSSVYEQVCEEFELNSLSSAFIKNKMVMFFELNLKKYLKIKKPKDTETEIKPPMPLLKEDFTADENDFKNKLYNVNSINFDELKCNFGSFSTFDLPEKIVEKLKADKKQLIALKSKSEFNPHSLTLLNKIEESKIFNNIFRVTCYDEMKYKPYGFFYELIAGIYNYSTCPMNFESNKFELFKEIDSSGFIKSLINLTEREFPHPEDVRYSFFDIFLNIFGAMKNTLIYIENFEKIDETSLEILQLIFEKLEEFDVSYLILEEKDYSLHKNAHFLLSLKNYTEISVKPSSVNEIISKNSEKYSNIMDSHYLKSIAQNAKGSLLYFDNAIDYLLEKDLLSLENNTLVINEFENVFIPPKLSELMEKRLKHLSSQNNEAYIMLSLLLMIGPMVDLFTIKRLQLPNDIGLIQFLAEKKYIYIYNNAIYIQNFGLLKNVYLKSTSIELKQEIAAELLQKIYSAPTKHPTETALYGILEQQKQEFMVWEKLARLNTSMGDFSAYLNCSIKLLKLLDNKVTEESQKTIEEYKMEVYENISNLLYKYTPSEVYNISKTILDNLENTINNKKIIDLCNKMLQGCLLSGNYSYALELINKILSKYPNCSIKPQDENFNLSFFLISLIKIEVLFSIGNLKECEIAGEEILDVLTPQQIIGLKPENLSQKQFDEVILDAMSFVAISKVILLRDNSNLNNFATIIKKNIGQIPDVFALFSNLNSLIKGIEFELSSDLEYQNDKFSKIIFNILKAFSTDRVDYKRFANDIYQAKITAKMQKLTQIELICDLLIGYSYLKLEQLEKASSIYYNVLELSTNNGLKLVTYLAWYLISMLKFKQEEIEVALGIANNAITQLEKDDNSSDYMFLLLRILLAELLSAKGDENSVKLCTQNIIFIKEKYKLV